MPANVTQILSAIDSGDPQAAAELLPLVYEELRKLADARLAQERNGQTLQATATSAQSSRVSVRLRRGKNGYVERFNGKLRDGF